MLYRCIKKRLNNYKIVFFPDINKVFLKIVHFFRLDESDYTEADKPWLHILHKTELARVTTDNTSSESCPH